MIVVDKYTAVPFEILVTVEMVNGHPVARLRTSDNPNDRAADIVVTAATPVIVRAQAAHHAVRVSIDRVILTEAV